MQKEELQKLIGQNLRRVRLEQGLTREMLAEKAGISLTFYSNLEMGNKMLSVVTLRKLADALCVSTDSLIYADHPDDPTERLRKFLRNQPENTIDLVEKISRLLIESDGGEL